MSFRARARPTDRECPHGALLQQEESTVNSMARRMFELVEPIGVIPYSADEPNEELFARLKLLNLTPAQFAERWTTNHPALP